MNEEERHRLEHGIRALWDAGHRDRAARAVIEGYGREIFGFLLSLHRSGQDAEDVFAIWSERVWRGWDTFSWQSSVRTWAYTIAGNASRNFVRDERARARRVQALPTGSALSRMAAKVRTETRLYLRSEAKRKLAEIRDGLPPEDRAILVLRIDKGLEWKDLARVTLGEESPSEERLSRECQRLRKRFQHLKARLVELARREGILGDG